MRATVIDLARYNPAEPRDDHGRWVSLVHSTYKENIPSILANGFRPSRGEGGYGVYFTPEGHTYSERSGDEYGTIKAKFHAKKTLLMGSGENDAGYAKYQEAAQEDSERPDRVLARQGYDSAEYHDPWGGVQFIVFDPKKIKIEQPQGQVVAGTHVTSASAAAEIEKNGFQLQDHSVVRGGNELGRGIYIGIPDTDNEVRSQALYEKQYRMRKTPSKTLNVEAHVKNPAVINYDEFSRKRSTDLQQVGETKLKAVFNQIPGFAETYDSLAIPRRKAYHDFLTSDKFGNEEGPGYPEVYADEVLKKLGYDSVILKTKLKSAKVGGSQLVVFDPSKVRVRKSADLSVVDLAVPQRVERHVVGPAIDHDTTVRSIAKVLRFTGRGRHQVDSAVEAKALRPLLAPYGVHSAAIRMALGLTHTEGGRARGTQHLPNAILSESGAELKGMVRDVRDHELFFRASYLANAAQRMQESLDKGLTQRDTLRAERTYYQAHERARKGRLRAAAQVQTAAGIYGQEDQHGTLVGWYLNPLLKNEAECRAANGHNFYAEDGTVIGLPGSVHANCGCYAGPPISGASMVNDVMGNVIKLARNKPKFKLKGRKYA